MSNKKRMKNCLLISFLFLFISCTKEYSFERTSTGSAKKHVLTLADTTLIGDTTNFYDIELNSARQLHIVNIDCIAIFGASGGAGYIIPNFEFFADTSASATFSFQKGNIKLTSADTSRVLYNQKILMEFSPGYYTYTKDPSNTNGIFLQFMNSVRNKWSTMIGAADQTNSSFQIVSQLNLDRDYHLTGISHFIHLYCKFNCILYDGKGNSVILTNGRLGISLWI